MTVAATLAERSHQAPSTKVAQLKAVTKNLGPSQCALSSVDLAISPGEVPRSPLFSKIDDDIQVIVQARNGREALSAVPDSPTRCPRHRH